MRVLHVAPDISRAFGGPTVALLGFIRASREAGIEAEVVAPEPPRDDLEWFESQSRGTSMHVFPVRGPGSARVAPGLLRFLRDEGKRFDVVHIHGTFNAISTLAARRCRKARIPYVIGPFGTLSRYTFAYKRRLLKRAYHAFLDAPAIRDAAALHFTTGHERDEAMRLPAVRGVPTAVVPPPWVPDRSASANGHGHARSVERRGASVLFLSRLHPIKGIETLIDAWPAVRARRPDARLVIAGSGDAEYERALKARVVQRGGGDSVRFTGFVTGVEKARLLGDAGVFVLPSHHENFGVAVLEAVAAGVPSVITPEVQIADVIAEHQLGEVVRREPDAFASAIVRVLDDDDLRANCAANGASLARSLFTTESTGTKLRAMYELALSHSTT